MSRKFRQFSLQCLFLTISCVGSRVVSRIVDLQQRAAAEHRQCDNFLALVARFPRDDRVHRGYCGARAYHHLAIAAEYEWAMFHPWLTPEERRAPPAPLAVLRMMKAFAA